MTAPWTDEKTAAILTQPFMTLLYEAHTLHRAHHHPAEIEAATLLSIKTGACAEDCGYCSQSGHYQTGVEKEKLLSLEAVLEKAKAAKASGADRFCMGAAWRSPPQKAMPELMAMIQAVKSLGLDTCMTLGMLDKAQALQLRDAGLDYYNHNLDTSEAYYDKVVTTRSYQDRLNTLAAVSMAGIKLCCGGILGLGESQADHIALLTTLANLSPVPQSVPINCLIPVKGTPLANSPPVDPIDLVRVVATARILMPTSRVRLTAGRASMSDELQALCFFAGANSIFLGERLLTEDNAIPLQDERLFKKLGLYLSSTHAAPATTA